MGEGMQHGLFLYWDLSGTPYRPQLLGQLRGLQVDIHAYGTPHRLTQQNNVLLLEPGSFTNIDIETVVTKRLPPPYDPHCTQQQYNIIRGFPYSKTMCEITQHQCTSNIKMSQELEILKFFHP